MSGIAIRAERLSKLYRIGARERYQTLRDTLTGAFKAPFTRRPDNRDDSDTALWALRDVSFTVSRGEVLGILGGNGAGKSTLLKVLSRITQPTSGRAEIHGRVGSLLEVGTGFHPELTGRENIQLNGAILGMTRVEIARRFDEIVAFAEIEKFVDTPVKRYSSGMYMRLAFSVAAHLETEILIIDEVLAVGDSNFQKKCLGRMGMVASEGKTVLFVSHNMTALQTLCNRALWLSKGEVEADGPAYSVVSRYLQSTATALTGRVWDDRDPASGNSAVRLHSARICARDVHHITVSDQFALELTFSNHLPGALLNVTFHIHTLEGTCVLASASPARTTRSGRVTARCHLPGNLLNDGSYRIQTMIVQNSASVLLNHPETMLLEIHDAPRQIAWYGKWPGVVRPDLSWDFVSSQEDVDTVELAERSNSA